MDRPPPPEVQAATAPPPAAPEADAPAAEAPPKRRRGPAVGCLVCLIGCAVLPLLLVVTSAAFYFGEYRRCATLTPTGDALFDHYAQALVEANAGRLFFATEDGSQLISLTDGELASWEAEFGGDPRYWQLRYSCTRQIPAKIEADLKARGLSPRVHYLEQARERGAVDAAVLYQLAREYYGMWYEQLPLVRPADPSVRPERADALEIEARIIEHHGEELLAILDEAVAAAPEESFPYYRRARFQLARGEAGQALTDLARGNAAPANRWPESFPYSFVIERLSRGELSGNETLTGLVLAVHLSEQLPNYGAWKAFGSRLLASEELIAEPSWRNEYHDFACRLGSLDGTGMLFVLVGSMLVRMQAEDLLVAHGAELSDAERQGLLGLALLNAELKKESTRLAERQHWLDERFAEEQSLLGRYASSLARQSPEWYRYWCEHQGIEYGAVRTRAVSGLNRLALFDYETLSFPPPWGMP